MSKKITLEQINAQAAKLGIEPAALRAVIEIECEGEGFHPDGTPVILYERHIFHRLLRQLKWITKANEWSMKYPNLCNSVSGGYGKKSEQHGRLAKAAELNRDVAIESCSWGLGQVMGYHWKSLGYESLQDFVNAMYKDEASQLEAMCRFITVNNLSKALARKDWVAFAVGYNGANQAKHNYSGRLAAAYARLTKK